MPLVLVGEGGKLFVSICSGYTISLHVPLILLHMYIFNPPCLMRCRVVDPLVFISSFPIFWNACLACSNRKSASHGYGDIPVTGSQLDLEGTVTFCNANGGVGRDICDSEFSRRSRCSALMNKAPLWGLRKKKRSDKNEGNDYVTSPIAFWV